MQLTARKWRRIVVGPDHCSRLLLLGRRSEVELLPLDLSKKVITAADFEAVGKRSAVDVSVVVEADFAAVIGGIGDHVQSNKSAAGRIKGQVHFGDVAGCSQDLGLSIDRRMRGGSVVDRKSTRLNSSHLGI